MLSALFAKFPFKAAKSAREEYSTLSITKTYNVNIARAISLARRLADPLTEITRLYNYEKDILSLDLHLLQDMVAPDLLYEHLGRACVLVTNAVGVDFNEMLRCSWKRHLLSFVAGLCSCGVFFSKLFPGLGPRKAAGLISEVKARFSVVPSRKALTPFMGPTVYRNAIGFIKLSYEDIRNQYENGYEYVGH